MATKRELVVLRDERLPDGMLFDGIDTTKGPYLSVGEVSKVFFGRGAHWLRHVEKQGRLYLDGKPILPSRKETIKPTMIGARTYTISDVEKMAHALTETGLIDGKHLIQVSLMLQSIGRIYGYFPMPELGKAPRQRSRRSNGK